MPVVQHHYWKGIAYSTVAAVMWAVLPIFLKMALRQTDPITIVWFRFVSALLLLLMLALLKNRHWFAILRKPPMLLWVTALTLAFNYLGYMMGVKYTTPSVSQVVIQFGPLLLALGGTLLFKERLQLIQWIGLAVFIIGFGFFYSDQAASLLQGNFSLGVLWILVAAIAWAIYGLGQKALVRHHPPQSLNIFIFLFSAVLYTPFADFASMPQWTSFTWSVLFFCGLNTFLAYGAVAEAIKCMPAAIVSVIIALNPILTMVIMNYLNRNSEGALSADLREAIGQTGLVGAILLISGAMAIIAGPKIKSEAKRFRLIR